MTVRLIHFSLHLPVGTADASQDLTFCYLHMTPQDLEVLDTLGTADYISGELSDTGSSCISILL